MLKVLEPFCERHPKSDMVEITGGLVRMREIRISSQRISVSHVVVKAEYFIFSMESSET